MELKVNELIVPERITWNYEELKKELTEKVQFYETLVYSDEQIKQAKADRAALNKLKSALNDERLRREREYMKPFNEFKAEVNEIIAIIDKPVAAIDKQVKEYEKKEQEEKRAKIEEMFDAIPTKPEWLKLAQIFDARWLNKSVTFRMIEDNMLGWCGRIESELATIAGLTDGAYEAEQIYKATLDMGKAIADGQRQARVQREKLEAEAKAADEKIAEMEKTPLPWGEEQDEAAKVLTGEKELEELRSWIAFEAYLNVEDAEALRAFCSARNIKIRAI